MSHHKIRTLVVDDSVFYRGILADTLKQTGHAEYLGYAANGKLALAKIEESPPDLVTLDVEMPGMNGIEVLKEIKSKFPRVQVVMVSATTQVSAENTIKALREGALDFIQKPTGSDQEANNRQLYRELRRVLSIVETKIILERGKGLDPLATVAQNKLPEQQRFERKQPIEIIVIGVSTGGPQALPIVLKRLPKSINVPVVIIQHLPALFVSVLVKSLNQSSNIEVVEITDNQPLKPGVAHIAPGGFHTKLIKESGSRVPITKLTNDPPVNFCRPSVDYFFRSVADIYHGNVLAVIMTGMGKDGAASIKLLKSYGASTIAQDEESSVVFGMPLEAINTGAIDEVVPLERIASAIARRVGVTHD